jgi:DNA-binding response OmpR family regulator
MEIIKLGSTFKKALLVEDSIDICDFYQEFFAFEQLQLDIMNTVPNNDLNIKDEYDVLVCDWLVGSKSSKEWLSNLHKENKLPKVTIVATGLIGIEDQLEGIPALLVYKPFDFYSLKGLMLNLKYTQYFPI